jgi:hypothetical protein
LTVLVSIVVLPTPRNPVSINDCIMIAPYMIRF